MADDPLDDGVLDVLLGATASGKTALALALAERTGAEIVSMDSMLVYRGMDVGTAKPSADERARVRHHVVDVVDPPERYDVLTWLADARAALADARARGRRVLFVGGTAFYYRALAQGLFEGQPVDEELRARIEARYDELGADAFHAELVRADPESAARLHPNDKKRVVRALEVFEQTGTPLSALQREWGFHGEVPPGRERRALALVRADDELDARIVARTRAMLAAGWVEEARAIRAGVGFGPTSIQALGYREVLAHGDGELDEDEFVELVARRTRRFARRQRTWLKRFDELRWIEAADGALEVALAHFEA